MNLSLFAFVTFATLPLLANLSCDVKLIEQVPALKIELRSGAEFKTEITGKISYNPADLVKLVELNGQIFTGDLNDYTVFSDENYAVAIKPVDLVKERYTSPLICSGAIQTDGFCNVEMYKMDSSGKPKLGFGMMNHPSLDEQLKGKYEKIEYLAFVNFSFNPTSSVVRTYFNMVGDFNGLPRDQSQMKMMLQPNQKAAATLSQYYNNLDDANFEITEGSGRGPRALELDVHCVRSEK